MKRLAILVTCGALVVLGGCATTATEHSKTLHSQIDRDMTVGVVQKEIKKGMTMSQVAEALGSPNIVTKDADDLETWIYDKVASEASYSRSSVGAGAGLGGGGTPGDGLIIGLLTGSYSQSAGASARTQKTLTVVIHFTDGKVSSFSYHTSKF